MGQQAMRKQDPQRRPCCQLLWQRECLAQGHLVPLEMMTSTSPVSLIFLFCKICSLGEGSVHLFWDEIRIL